jgi:sensor domain CHASE-containing protein
MSAQLKHILALLFVAAMLGGVYYMATSVDFFATARKNASDVQQETENIQNEIIAQLDKVKAITFDESMFTAKAYTNLEDKTVPLTTPNLARPNPFAPR